MKTSPGTKRQNPGLMLGRMSESRPLWINETSEVFTIIIVFLKSDRH